MTGPRKVSAGLTAIVAMIALAACSSSSSTSASGGSSASAAGSASGKTVVYIPGLTGNPFYTSVGCGASTEAATMGVKFSVQGASTFSVPLQTQVLNSVIASKPAAIMISITDPVAMYAPLAKARADGIKVITIDGDLENQSVGVTNIQSNDITGGQLAADALGKLVGGRSGQVLIIDNATGSIISGDRAKGFVDELKAKFPNITVLNTQYSNNSTATAASIARTAASTNPNLVGIYTLETDNTEGAITGIREAGKTGKVYLVGYDTSDPIVAGLQAGAVNADIVQYPYGEGVLGIQSAVDAIEGKPVPRDQTVGFVVATPSNVNTATVQKYIYKTHC
jgi:ribose transport system substrate-binding protein